jgi:hypothetical protein
LRTLCRGSTRRCRSRKSKSKQREFQVPHIALTNCNYFAQGKSCFCCSLGSKLLMLGMTT